MQIIFLNRIVSCNIFCIWWSLADIYYKVRTAIWIFCDIRDIREATFYEKIDSTSRTFDFLMINHGFKKICVFLKLLFRVLINAFLIYLYIDKCFLNKCYAKHFIHWSRIRISTVAQDKDAHHLTRKKIVLHYFQVNKQTQINFFNL